MNKYYVYIHRRSSDNRVFYVGKGCGRRAFRGDRTARSGKWLNVANKHEWSVEIVFDSLTEDEAYELEVETIKEFKHFNEPLVNHNNGGHGGKPALYTKQMGEKISESLKAYYSKNVSAKKGCRGFKFWENGRSNLHAWLNLPTFYEYHKNGVSFTTSAQVFPQISKTTFKKVYEYFETIGDPNTDEQWLVFKSQHKNSIPLVERPARAFNKFKCDKLIENIADFEFQVKKGSGDKALGKYFKVIPSSAGKLRRLILSGYDYKQDDLMMFIQKRFDHLKLQQNI